MAVNKKSCRNECVSVTNIHICTANMQVTSSLNLISFTENPLVYKVWSIMSPWNYRMPVPVNIQICLPTCSFHYAHNPLVEFKLWWFIARLLERRYDLWYHSSLIHCFYNWNMFEKVILSFIPKLNLTGSRQWRTRLCPSRKMSSGSVRPLGSLNHPSAGWRMASNWWRRYGRVFNFKNSEDG